MKRPQALSGLVLIGCLLAVFSAPAGRPLVVKTKEGKFAPALAREWIKSGEYSFRFVLEASAKAPQVAAEIKDRIAPIKVHAPDDLTLVFTGANLTEEVLLEKLSGISLGPNPGSADALAALAILSQEGGPALGDLSSAGSIRASKKFELPPANQRRQDTQNIFGTVVQIKKCEPMPTLTIRITAAPKEGPHQKEFKPGDKILIRGFYKIHDQTKKIEPEEERTQLNLKTAEIKPGDKVFGKPFVKEGPVWILETIDKL